MTEKLHTPNNHCVFASTLNAIRTRHPIKLEALKVAEDVFEIGFGHRQSALPGMRISSQQAEDLFRADVSHCEAYIRSRLFYPMTDGRYQAYISLFYDVGPHAALRHCLAILDPGASDLQVAKAMPAYAELSRFRLWTGQTARLYEAGLLGH